MAKQVKLTAQTRLGVGRTAVKNLKKEGSIPAVIYGAKQEALSLQVSAREISALLSHAVGENILVDLEINDGGKKTSRMALIQEVQHHPVRRDVLHVDFHAVSMDEKLTASIPVEPFGESIGVKSYGGLLEQSVRSIEIECLPKDLPELIRVDISALNVGDSIHIRDLALPTGVTAVGNTDLTVFIVAEPKVEEAAPGAPAATAPEVIKEKKEEGAAAEKK